LRQTAASYGDYANKKIQPEGLDFLQFDFGTLPEDGRGGI
jgi:hypothetical protein